MPPRPSTHPTEERAASAYRKLFGAEPEVVASAPGRINLIGEHTDYQGGFVLPCAISRRVAVAIGKAGTDAAAGTLHSADFDETKPLDADGRDGTWADYPRAVRFALRESGREVPAFRAAFSGDVPLGGGLSSSAAIEAATILALDKLFGLDLERAEAAKLCQRAENGYVGVNSGVLDQFASLMCRAGEALFLDCRTLENDPVPLNLAAARLSLIVCDTNTPRTLADTGYNDRRTTAEAAARTLGVTELRDASESDLGKLSGDELKRARHIVTENRRVIEAVEALQNRDFAAFGRLMYASHDSMRDDYEISTPSHDEFVRLALDTGAVGARLTGGGFGGCAIALVPDDKRESLTDATLARFRDLDLPTPTFHEFTPAAGATVGRAL